MAIGDISINTFTIGSVNINDASKVSLSSFDIYEDILDPYGPVGEVKMFDYNDTMSQANFNGGEDVTISFSTDNSESLTFNFKPLKSTNDDRSNVNSATGKNKLLDVKFISPEFNNAISNPVNYSNTTQTSLMVKDFLTKFLKTTKQIDIQEQTKGNRRLDFKNEEFAKAWHKLNNEHVSSDHQSSCYTCFVQGGSSPKYVFATFEKLFEQSSIVTLKQTNTLATGNANETDKLNSILWYKVPETFFTPSRWGTNALAVTYDPATGRGTSNTSPPPTNFTVLGNQVYKTPLSTTGNRQVRTHLDSSNNLQKTFVDEARRNRASFLAQLSQNSADLEVPGNPAIKLGSVITISIPNKSVTNTNGADGEKQINGKALVVGIHHKIGPLSKTPRYTMVLKIVKASFEEGGGGVG